jgi:hypothetical protein
MVVFLPEPILGARQLGLALCASISKIKYREQLRKDRWYATGLVFYSSLWYYYNMKHEFQTIKIWKDTYKSIRLLAAMTGELMVVLIQRLVKEEHERFKTKENENGTMGK